MNLSAPVMNSVLLPRDDSMSIKLSRDPSSSNQPCARVISAAGVTVTCHTGRHHSVQQQLIANTTSTVPLPAKQRDLTRTAASRWVGGRLQQRRRLSRIVRLLLLVSCSGCCPRQRDGLAVCRKDQSSSNSPTLSDYRSVQTALGLRGTKHVRCKNCANR